MGSPVAGTNAGASEAWNDPKGPLAYAYLSADDGKVSSGLKTMRKAWIFFVLLAAAGAAFMALAAAPPEKLRIWGTVRASTARQMSGVLVRVTNLDRGTSVSTFTGGNGNYRFDDLEPGHYEVRVLKRGFVTTARRVTPGGPIPRDFGMVEHPHPPKGAAPADITARFPEDTDKPLIVDSCLRCHSAFDLALQRNDRQKWQDIVTRMVPLRRSKAAPEETERIVNYFSKHFGPERPQMAPFVEQAESPPRNALPVLFRQFAIPEPPPADGETPARTGTVGLSSLVVAPDAALWFTLRNANRVGRFDPGSGAFRSWPLPTPGSGPEGIVYESEENLWLAQARTGSLGRFDSKTGSVEEVKTTDNPGTLARDSRGNLYFTLPAKGQIGRRDAATGAIRIASIPALDPHPVDLAIDSKDRIWWCQLFTDALTSLDLSTGTVKQYPTPNRNSAPRALALDKDGKVWFVEWLGNKLARLDPDSGSIVEYELPTPSSEPSAIAVDVEQKIWIAGNLSNTLIRFDPASTSFVEYPLPAPRAQIRKLAADPARGVWFAATHPGIIGHAAGLAAGKR